MTKKGNHIYIFIKSSSPPLANTPRRQNAFLDTLLHFLRIHGLWCSAYWPLCTSPCNKRISLGDISRMTFALTQTTWCVMAAQHSGLMVCAVSGEMMDCEFWLVYDQIDKYGVLFPLWSCSEYAGVFCIFHSYWDLCAVTTWFPREDNNYCNQWL